jgi:hypothetical protein
MEEILKKKNCTFEGREEGKDCSFPIQPSRKPQAQPLPNNNQNKYFRPFNTKTNREKTRLTQLLPRRQIAAGRRLPIF